MSNLSSKIYKFFQRWKLQLFDLISTKNISINQWETINQLMISIVYRQFRHRAMSAALTDNHAQHHFDVSILI